MDEAERGVAVALKEKGGANAAGPIRHAGDKRKAAAAPRASGAAAASPDHADGDGPLAGMKDMTRDQWAEVNGKLNDDELRDSVHASMQLCEVRSCDVL